MNELTGKDKAIAQALLSAGGFEAQEPDIQDEEIEVYLETLETGGCYEVGDWLISYSTFEGHILAGHNSKIILIPHQGLDTDDAELLAVRDIIHAAATDYEAAKNQLSLFKVAFPLRE